MTRQTDPAEIVKGLPDWVIEEALRRNGNGAIHLTSVRETPFGWRPIILLAQALLEPAMEPPVDPLEAEAREICARRCDVIDEPTIAQEYRNGTILERDDNVLAMVLAALKRGVEIERLRQVKGEG